MVGEPPTRAMTVPTRCPPLRWRNEQKAHPMKAILKDIAKLDKVTHVRKLTIGSWISAP
jgi:hypothetical protein